MTRFIDMDFCAPRYPVTIINVDCSDEARTLRGFVEGIGGIVHLHDIGTPGDFLKVIRQGAGTSPEIVICAHGRNGIVFGEYADFIDTTMLTDGDMPAACIATHIHLPGVRILNTACRGGSPTMAEAFMAGDLESYIGYDGDPHGCEGLMFPIHYFYHLIHGKCRPEQAWKKASAFDEESRRWFRYDATGRHSVPK